MRRYFSIDVDGVEWRYSITGGKPLKAAPWNREPNWNRFYHHFFISRLIWARITSAIKYFPWNIHNNACWNFHLLKMNICCSSILFFLYLIKFQICSSYEKVWKKYHFYSCFEPNVSAIGGTQIKRRIELKGRMATATVMAVAKATLQHDGNLYNRYPVEMVINQFERGKSASAASFKTTRARDKIQIVCLAQLFMQDRVYAFCHIFFALIWVPFYGNFFWKKNSMAYHKEKRGYDHEKNARIFFRTKKIVSIKKRASFYGGK